MNPSSANPLVSIIIPSYNQGRYIKAAIESCLSQDYRPLEIIVVDGASKDDTVDVLKGFEHVPEVVWISEPDHGVADAVNKGFRMAKGTIAGIQSSDDAYLPGSVAAAVQEFLADDQLGVVYSNWVYVDAEGKNARDYVTGSYSLENFLSTDTLIPQHAAFFRLELALAVGGWNERYFVADTEMWLRMAFRTKFKKLETFWGVRRMHPEQRNQRADIIAEAFGRMIDESPDIAGAPSHVRRAAQCGKFLTKARYNPSGKKGAQWRNFWNAYLAYPSIRKSQNLSAHLVPGYWQLGRARILADLLLRGIELIIRATQAIQHREPRR